MAADGSDERLVAEAALVAAAQRDARGFGAVYEANVDAVEIADHRPNVSLPLPEDGSTRNTGCEDAERRAMLFRHVRPFHWTSNGPHTTPR